MLNLNLDDYLKWAPRLKRAFGRVAQFLRKECFFDNRDLPYRTQLVPLAAMMTISARVGSSPRSINGSAIGIGAA